MNVTREAARTSRLMSPARILFALCLLPPAAAAAPGGEAAGLVGHAAGRAAVVDPASGAALATPGVCDRSPFRPPSRADLEALVRTFAPDGRGPQPRATEAPPAAEAEPTTEAEPTAGAGDDGDAISRGRRAHWKASAEQALLFLGVQHGYALTQPKTRRDLRGPFFKDYFRSVKSLGGWADGGRFFTNYVAHPMQGSLLAFVWVQNDPQGKSARFGRSASYWRSRAKAVAWSAAWSAQFEIGPVSQASIGNVGLHGKQTWVDLVVTPVGGAAWLVAEDALDRYVVRRLEARTDNALARIAARVLLNPTRSAANLLRLRRPWRRDRQSQ